MGGEKYEANKCRGLVGGLLELVYWTPLPKSGVESHVGGHVGDALNTFAHMCGGIEELKIWALF